MKVYYPFSILVGERVFMVHVKKKNKQKNPKVPVALRYNESVAKATSNCTVNFQNMQSQLLARLLWALTKLSGK